MLNKISYIKIIFSVFPIFLGLLLYFNPLIDNSYIRNYGPDFLWSFSLFFTQYTFNSFNGNILCISVSSLLISFLYEFGQKFSYLDGTFDFFDLITYLFGFLVAYLTMYILKTGEREMLD